MSNPKLKLAAQYLRNADLEELSQTLNSLLPLLLERLTPRERLGFLKIVLQNHLEDFLAGVSPSEREKLLKALLPTLLKEFPLDKIDFLSLFA